VAVSDLAKARRFYGDLLGLQEIPRPAFDFPGAWYALGGGLSLHVIVKDDLAARPVEAHRFDIKDPHFALLVDDADATFERLSRIGRPVHDFLSTPTGLRQLFVHDDDGNMIEFIGPTKQPRVRRMESEA
jgi:catechol 2,3-dioxygenase-like lactoylglutathione lyase family enzyme